MDGTGTCEDCKCIQIIASIAKEILSQFDIYKIVQISHSQVNKIINSPLIAVGMYHAENNELLFYGYDAPNNVNVNGSLPLSRVDNWAVQCFTTSEEIIVERNESSSPMMFSKLLFSIADADRKSFVYIPLVFEQRTVGVLTLQSFEEQTFTKAHLSIIRIIASYISIAIENAQNFQSVQSQKQDLKIVIDNMEDIIDTRTQEIQKKNEELEILSIVAKKTENAIMIMNAQGDVIWINDYFTNIYGYTLEQFVCSRGANIMQTSFNSHIETYLSLCVSHKKAVEYNALNVTYSGKEVWTQTTLSPILDEHKTIKYLVAIDSDISKVKDAERRITEKNEEIVQSMEYASRIQRAAFPSIDSIHAALRESFIFWKPLDIVSGDFYWVKQNEFVTIIVLGDCTGHGVPGALLSMLGCSFLEDIIQNYQHENAADVLHQLQLLFEKRFRHIVMGEEVYDGMDVGICVYKHDTGTLHFAGANQDLICCSNTGLLQIKGDRMCVGGQHEPNYTFTNQSFRVSEDQSWYLFSDGFSSQFGGERGKKYMKKRLVQTFENMQSIPMSRQKAFLKHELAEWMGDTYEQVDDVLVLGFKL
ncbi:MAG: SpoIIE family protein phosphatase [Bacteroidota bacterium]